MIHDTLVGVSFFCALAFFLTTIRRPSWNKVYVGVTLTVILAITNSYMSILKPTDEYLEVKSLEMYTDLISHHAFTWVTWYPSDQTWKAYDEEFKRAIKASQKDAYPVQFAKVSNGLLSLFGNNEEAQKSVEFPLVMFYAHGFPQRTDFSFGSNGPTTEEILEATRQLSRPTFGLDVFHQGMLFVQAVFGPQTLFHKSLDYILGPESRVGKYLHRFVIWFDDQYFNFVGRLPPSLAGFAEKIGSKYAMVGGMLVLLLIELIFEAFYFDDEEETPSLPTIRGSKK